MSTQPNSVDVQTPISLDSVSRLTLAKQLIKGRAVKDVLRDLHLANNTNLATDEEKKNHPLVGFSLPAKQWPLLKSFLLDGGGVDDDQSPIDDGPSLLDSTIQSLHDDDQSTFWPCLLHIFKHWMKKQGYIVPLPNGGVSLVGAPTHPLVANPPTPFIDPTLVGTKATLPI